MQSVYLDACMVIYLVEGDSRHQQLLKQALLGKTVFSSELVRLESRIKALRENNTDFLTVYEQFFNGCRMINLDRAVFDQAAQLRVSQRLKTPDALHLAAAIVAECDQFWTNDQQLVKVANEHFQRSTKRLEIIVLNDMEGLEGML